MNVRGQTQARRWYWSRQTSNRTSRSALHMHRLNEVHGRGMMSAPKLLCRLLLNYSCLLHSLPITC